MSMSIAANNSVYSSEDGILYNKNKTVLLRFPEGKTDNVFTIPNSVTGIGNAAFQSCANLAAITIPDNVTSIGNDAFFDCLSLASVIMGNGVTSIGVQAFDWCPSLASVTFHSVIPSNGFPYNGSSRAVGMPPPPPPPTFPGDLVVKSLAFGGGIGTYTRTPPSTTWSKQPRNQRLNSFLFSKKWQEESSHIFPLRNNIFGKVYIAAAVHIGNAFAHFNVRLRFVKHIKCLPERNAF
jgi:hypothetical protein